MELLLRIDEAIALEDSGFDLTDTRKSLKIFKKLIFFHQS